MPPRTARTTRLKMTAESAPTPGVPVSVSREKSLLPAVMVLSTLLLIALSVAGYFYYQYRHSAQVADAKEIADLSQEIGAVMMLPEGEVPTLATVTDREKLAEQAFFEKAENGDKVLIYSQSGRAILYRPSIKKIIDVTTVNVNTPAPVAENSAVTETVPEPQVEPEIPVIPSIVRLALFNGSTTLGITNAKEKELTTAYSNIAVVSKDAAKKNDYEKTVVVDVTGKNTDMAAKIAATLGGSVSSLPDGEVAPSDADIMVIIGQE